MSAPSPNIKHYFATNAFINGAWQNDVVIEVSDGLVSHMSAGSSPSDCETLSGPVLPSIPNLHSHAFQYLMAGMTEVSLNPNDSFWSWRDLMYKIVSQLSPSDIEIIASQLYIDMLKAGYTQVGEFQYLFNNKNGVAYQNPCEISERLVSAAHTANIGITLLPTLYSHSGFGGQQASDGQKRFINTTEQYLGIHSKMSQSLAGHKLNTIGHCFHSLRAVTKEQMAAVISTIEEPTPIHIHIAEQQKEIQDCIEWSGQRPVEWLFDNVEVNQHWCLVHATHLSSNEITSIANSHAVVGLCPTTEANLGDGIFPGVEYTKLSGRWGIGSDSHISVSVKDELRGFEYSQRLNDLQRNRLYGKSNTNVGEYLLHQAQIGGNQALQVNNGLVVGQRADFLVLDGSHPMLAWRDNRDIINSWIFASNDNIVKDVFVAGEPIIENFHHPEEERCRVEFSKVMKNLFS
jgi:formimidoylglutamate deiminase